MVTVSTNRSTIGKKFPGATLPSSLARLLQAARSHRDSANPETPVVVVSTNGNFTFVDMITKLDHTRVNPKTPVVDVSPNGNSTFVSL